MAVTEEFFAIQNILEQWNCEFDKETISLVLAKYITMNGRFSHCGATKDRLTLCVNDEFSILENIVYTLGIQSKI